MRHHQKGRRLAAVLVGAALLGGCAAGSAQPPAGSAAAPAPASTHEPAPAGAPAAPVPSASPDGAVLVPPVPVASAALGAATAAPAVAPTRIIDDQLGFDVPVDPVGVREDGAMQIPDDAARAGWYRFGPGIGQQRGTAVVAAHAGSRITPRGPFYELRESSVGDTVRAVAADGTETVYRVVAVERLSKATIDLAQYFRRDGEPRLVLMTCGGRWNKARQSYEDNIVVTAILVDR
ncbi:class F sortase [Georgenia thermotolerans]|uniref:Sortase n=1 Tax=Georgenia thermotolerans TaxID=527326 RepID=A0A7J5UJS9_9MICO|nr:class F sortase [Georgenia thermotolerans]KAE8762404.1 sortase [Georgenia thermotolerans]